MNKKGVPKREFVKVECEGCGKELVLSTRQRSKLCQKCYNERHDKKVYWKEGGEDYEDPTSD